MLLHKTQATRPAEASCSSMVLNRAGACRDASTRQPACPLHSHRSEFIQRASHRLQQPLCRTGLLNEPLMAIELQFTACNIGAVAA